MTTKSPPAALGALLSTLRNRARLSQRELARVSGISYTQIGDLERTVGGWPSPLTLRALARGLASDAFIQPTGYDVVRSDAFYRQLMDATGYLTGLPVGAPPATTEDDVRQYLAGRSGDTTMSDRLLALARRYPDLEPDDQLVARRLIDGWLRDE